VIGDLIPAKQSFFMGFKNFSMVKSVIFNK
jgi:hypothetical protein